MNGVQQDHGTLAFGLERIVAVRRPEFERLLPETAAFLALDRPRPRLHLLGADLHLDIRINEDVAIPSGMFGRAALGSDDVVAAALRSVEQREDELVA